MELADAKITYPLDTQKIVNLYSEIDNIKEGIKILEKLQKEFGF